MQPHLRRHVPGWFRFVGAVGALVSVSMLSGCPGTLDPDVLKMATGSGTGNGGSGSGGTGTGGTNPTGGASGTGGTMASNCTGANDGATLVANQCATSFCHDSSSVEAGLDLTVDATIGARLVGVMSQGINGSVCGPNWPTPYLKPGVTPAAGLLIDKITMSSGTALCPGGASMPYGIAILPTAKQACIEQWAEGLVMAAP